MVFLDVGCTIYGALPVHSLPNPSPTSFASGSTERGYPQENAPRFDGLNPLRTNIARLYNLFLDDIFDYANIAANSF